MNETIETILPSQNPASTETAEPPIEHNWQHDDLLQHVKALGAAASILKEQHKKSSFCEFPRTCGGCHFWSGVIEACNDIVSGDKTTIRKAKAIIERSSN